MANSTVEYILRIRDEATATLKDSASEADHLAGSLGDVEDAAKKAGPSLRDLGGAGESASKRVGDFGGQIQKIAGGLDLIHPALGDLARNFADVADVVEVAGGGIDGAEVAVTGLVPALAAAAVGAAALVAGYSVLANAATTQVSIASDQATAYLSVANSAEAAEARVRALADAQAASNKAQTDAGYSLALLRGDLKGYEVDAAKAADAVRAASQADIAARQANIAEIQRQIQANVDLSQQGQGDAASRQRARQEVERLTQVRQAETAALRNQQEQASQLANQLSTEIITRGQAEEATKAHEDAIKRSTEAQKQAADAAKKLADANDAALAGGIGLAFEGVARDARSLAGAFDDLGDPFAQAQADAHALAQAQATLSGILGEVPIQSSRVQGQIESLTEAYFGGQVSTEGYAAALDVLTAAQQRATEADAAAQAQAAQATQRAAVGRVTGAIESASSLSALVKVDPSGISEAVYAGLSGLADIGNGGGIFAEATDLLTGAAKGLAKVPSVIGDTFQTVMSEVLPSLIGSLITLVPTLIIETLSALVDPKFWVEVGIEIGKAVADAVRDLITPDLKGAQVDVTRKNRGIAGESIALGEGTTNATGGAVNLSGSYASGTDFVPSTGLYLLHRGETVSGNGRSSPGASYAKQSVSNTYVFNGYDMEEVARKLRELQRRGVVY